MMLKVDEVKEGSIVKSFDYTFKSNNQTYRIILSLLDNYTRFTINMTEKVEKICFSTEFTTSEKVNKCSKGIFNRIDFFYYNVVNIFESNKVDGVVTKDGTFQLTLPYGVMNNTVENMIIDVEIEENDEVWRLKQTILDLREELNQVKPEVISFEKKFDSKNCGYREYNQRVLFTHKSNLKGPVIINVSFSFKRTNCSFDGVSLLIGETTHMISKFDGDQSMKQFRSHFDLGTEIKVVTSGTWYCVDQTARASIELLVTITTCKQFVYQ
ncbi:hypothetical protein ABK040_013969 [Willaertia magna]